MVQWLGLCASTTWHQVQIPQIPQAPWHGKKSLFDYIKTLTLLYIQKKKVYIKIQAYCTFLSEENKQN